jgi:hypothetical protein
MELGSFGAEMGYGIGFVRRGSPDPADTTDRRSPSPKIIVTTELSRISDKIGFVSQNASWTKLGSFARNRLLKLASFVQIKETCGHVSAGSGDPRRA